MKWFKYSLWVVVVIVAIFYFGNITWGETDNENELLSAIYHQNATKVEQLLLTDHSLQRDALTYAVQYSTTDILQLLLQAGYDAQLTEKDRTTEMTPYELAIHLNDSSMQFHLLAYAKEKQLPLNERKTVHDVVEEGNYQHLKDMIQAGFNINEVDQNGNSLALLIAQRLNEEEDSEIVYYLERMMDYVLLKRIDLSIANNEGMTFTSYIQFAIAESPSSALSYYRSEIKQQLMKYDYYDEYYELKNINN